MAGPRRNDDAHRVAQSLGCKAVRLDDKLSDAGRIDIEHRLAAQMLAEDDLAGNGVWGVGGADRQMLGTNAERRWSGRDIAAAGGDRQDGAPGQRALGPAGDNARHLAIDQVHPRAAYESRDKK